MYLHALATLEIQAAFRLSLGGGNRPETHGIFCNATRTDPQRHAVNLLLHQKHGGATNPPVKGLRKVRKHRKTDAAHLYSETGMLREIGPAKMRDE